MNGSVEEKPIMPRVMGDALNKYIQMKLRMTQANLRSVEEEDE